MTLLSSYNKKANWSRDGGNKHTHVTHDITMRETLEIIGASRSIWNDRGKERGNLAE